MKVSLSRHGGQAAGINMQRPPQIVDSSALDDALASELKLLAASAAAEAAPVRSERVRDDMSYTITIDDNGHQTELSQSDTAMSPEFGKLLAWLRRHFGK